MINTKYINQRFGRLTVLDVYRKNNRTYSKCRCDCGNEKEILFDNVRRGLIQSCLCLNREVITKHGFHGTKVYAAWQHMIRRCEGDNEESERLYKDNGIKVCKSWMQFDNFYRDMGDPPTPQHSVDRINGRLGYKKSNCRWATKVEQSRNTNRNRLIEFKGETRCMSEWAELYGFRYGLIVSRLQKGWDIEKALTTPIMKEYQRFKKA